ncbi:MAG: prepilin-type N-terminal cleavage/methylation domain-containing protein [Campylobacterales bacterium]|nr:prepilin-type N-terminal cleavage/methylation domain-containing protein [Campylobacterales bacterium]
MKFRNAFTLIELVFVIVVIGIIGKFGVEFLAGAYKDFIYSNVNNTLQANSATAVEFISTRLQHRIKDSIIARKSSDNSFVALGSASGEEYTILEWVGADIDGLRGNSDSSLPTWSGVIDLDLSNKTTIFSPETNTTELDELIDTLSDGGSSINDAALYFVGSSSDITTGYGWNGTPISDQNRTMHPIIGGATFASTDGNFSEIYEYYQLAWSAYAVSIENYDTTTKMSTLVLYYDYQPWNGENYTNGKSATIMENVSSFRFMAIGSLVKIQVCAKSDLVEEYSLCKEKTIY